MKVALVGAGVLLPLAAAAARSSADAGASTSSSCRRARSLPATSTRRCSPTWSC